MYCNHDAYSLFQSKLSSGSCPYHYMNQNTSNAVDARRCNEYGTVTPTFFRLPQSNLHTFNSDFNITRILLNSTFNSQITDHVYYYCYCPSTLRFGIFCDEYTNVWVPARYNLIPFLFFGLRILLLFVIVITVFIPRFYDVVFTKMPLDANALSYVKQLFKIFRKLSFHCIFFMCFSIVTTCVDDFNSVLVPQTTFYYMTNNFKIIGWFTANLSYGTLLVIWANVYQRTSSQSSKSKVTTSLKILLLLIYLTQILVGIGSVTALFVLQGIGQHEHLPTVWYIVDIFGFASTFILSIFFSIYGIRMYRFLKKANTKTSLKRVRFAHFMIITVPVLWHTGLWMIIYVLMTKRIISNIWFNLYTTFVIDASFLLLFLLMNYVLFDEKMFLSLPCVCKFRKPVFNEDKKEQLLDAESYNEENDYNYDHSLATVSSRASSIKSSVNI
ncbi:7 TM domain-containing transmembrane protein [Acrasis kona]|uniref:7 TM domain-containing transmembrane protein n=1 Tax=Acrasis kona TaxID=1008807 RepID=A0AAW2ZA13_9EUKA